MKQNTVLANRTMYYDALRIVAAFAVILIHTAAQNWYGTDVHSLEWNIFNICDSIARWAVPVFTMISGALFLNGSHSIEKIYKKNIFRIMIAFIFWSLIYGIVDYTKGSGIRGFLESFGHYHLWYLFIIVGLYIIIPCLKKLMESDDLIKYFLFLALIFNFILPQFLSLLSFVSEGASSMAKNALAQMNFHFTLGYSVYFVCGAYLSKINIGKRLERIIYILGSFGFISTILFTAIISTVTGKATGVFYGYFTLNVLFESIAVFVFFKKHCTLENASDRVKLWIQRLSKYSFGAYLVHALILEQLDQKMGWNSLCLHPCLSIPMIVCIVFGISFCISALLNHLPIFRKYIV